MISHFFVSFFPLVSAPLHAYLPFAPTLQHSITYTHTYTTHINTVYTGLPLLITICKTSPPHPFIFPPFPQLSCYFSLPASLPLPFQPALPPPIALFSLSPALSQPYLMCGCKRRCFDLTLGLFSTSVHCCRRPCGVLGGLGQSLLFVEWGSPANMLIQNTNLELTSKGGVEIGVQYHFFFPQCNPPTFRPSLSLSFAHSHSSSSVPLSPYASMHT